MKDTDRKLPRILTTGAGGMVGSYVDFGLKADKNMLDIADLKAVFNIVQKYKPRVIIHLAAETDVDRCERDPVHSYTVNSTGTYNIALAAREIKAKMVYVSTDAVFDGAKKSPYSEEDIPRPTSYYGHSKYLGELAVRGISRNFLLVRTSWVFGGGPQKDKKFVGKIMGQLLKSDTKEFKVSNDSRSSPTYAKDLVTVIKKLIIEDKNGLFHVTNSGIATRYDMAKEILKVTGLKPKLLAVKSKFFNPDVRSISTGGLISKSIKLRFWQEALEEYLKDGWKPFLNC